jgi:hypothetical protein
MPVGLPARSRGWQSIKQPECAPDLDYEKHLKMYLGGLGWRPVVMPGSRRYQCRPGTRHAIHGPGMGAVTDPKSPLVVD